MDDPKSLDGWPSQRAQMGTVAQLHALGQITLIYNYLEEAMEILFRRCMPTEHEFSRHLFNRLNNRDRVDLLTAVVQATEKQDAELREALLHCLRGYDICTQNRNILMHASFELTEANIIQLSKKAANDPTREICFRESLENLRRVADEIEQIFHYCLLLNIWLVRWRSAWNPLQALTVLLNSGERAPLPDKPPKPRTLTPYLPEVAPPTEEPQPPPSGK